MSGTAIALIIALGTLVFIIGGVAARNRQRRDDRDGGLHADTGHDGDGGGDGGGGD